MSYKEQFEYCERVGRHVDLRKATAWSLGTFFPIALALSAFTAWHNHLVGTPTAFHILMRVVIGYAAFGGGMTVFFFQVIRPAIAATAAEEEDEDAT